MLDVGVVKAGLAVGLMCGVEWFVDLMLEDWGEGCKVVDDYVVGG